MAISPAHTNVLTHSRAVDVYFFFMFDLFIRYRAFYHAKAKNQYLKYENCNPEKFQFILNKIEQMELWFLAMNIHHKKVDMIVIHVIYVQVWVYDTMNYSAL